MSLKHIHHLDEETLELAIETFKAGGIVVCPSDTVYGLLVDAQNEQAVRKLISFKERPVGKAISVFVDGLEMMSQIVDTSYLTDSSRSLLPGPYTMVLPSRSHVSKLLESEKGTLGVRWIGNEFPISNFQFPISSPADFVTTLVSRYGRPVTATSANLAGKPSCYSIDALMGQLSDKKRDLLDLVIDAGDLPRRSPSTVLDLTTPTPQVLRSGSAQTQRTIQTSSPEETMQVAEDFIRSLRSQTSPMPSSFLEEGVASVATEGVPAGSVHLPGHLPPLRVPSSRRDMQGPLVIYLHGDLGAGKTHFVKGIARHFGFDRIVSPTYVGMHEYVNDRVKLYHVDLYNYPMKEDIDALQLEKLMTPGSIICIEWSEVAKMPHEGVHIYIEYVNQYERTIKMHLGVYDSYGNITSGV